MRAYINENPDRRDKITFLDEPFDINKLSRPFIVNELRLAYLELLEWLDIEKEKDTNSIEQKRLYELEKRVEEYLKQ